MECVYYTSGSYTEGTACWPTRRRTESFARAQYGLAASELAHDGKRRETPVARPAEQLPASQCSVYSITMMQEHTQRLRSSRSQRAAQRRDRGRRYITVQDVRAFTLSMLAHVSACAAIAVSQRHFDKRT